MADIGLMGGTFDPIHNGHLLLAKQAYEEYHLDQVWFMPSGTPPHKTDHRVTDAGLRCEMVRLAIKPYPQFVFSDFEVTRCGNTYTAQTLRLLHQAYPQHRFFFIVGADSIYEIETWYHPREVMEQTVILAARREYPDADRTLEEQIAYLTDRYQARIFLLHCSEVDISSAELRGHAAGKQQWARYVPGPVADFIAEHGLYEENQDE